MLPRSTIKEFALANPMYKGALVTAFTIDEEGEATNVKASLYDGPGIDALELPNPQTLSGEGRFIQPVYYDVPVILTVTGLTVASHDTGIIYPTNVVQPRETVAYTDDFLGDTLRAEWGSASGSDGQVVAPAILAGQKGGAVRMTTGDDAAASMAVNGVQLHLGLNFIAEDGGLAIEIRVKASAITDLCLFVGLTDQVAALEMPLTIAGVTPTGAADDCVGALFDTSATAARWKLVGNDSGTEATVQDAEVAPVADTYDYWRIEVTDDGDAYFFRNGTAVGEVMEGAVSPDVLLTPVIAAFSRGAASRDITADIVHIEHTRA